MIDYWMKSDDLEKTDGQERNYVSERNELGIDRVPTTRAKGLLGIELEKMVRQVAQA